MELSRLTKRKVELYNEGMASRNVLGVARHFDEVLAADPDMVLWVLTPWELSNPQFQISAPSAGPITSELGSMKRTFATESIPDAFRDLSPQLLAFFLQHARSIQVLQHYLYQSRSLYVRSYLMKGEDETGFLRAEPGSRWKGYLQQLDTNAAEIGKRAKAAGVPLVVVLLPNRAQAAMISMRESPKGYDPYELGNELRAIVERNGGTYIDILDGFRALPNSEQYYFPIDGHPDVDGHRIISGLLANALTSGTVPALRSLVQQRASLEQK
jgi:hypothetical protein